jgi:hypothetical protein
MQNYFLNWVKYEEKIHKSFCFGEHSMMNNQEKIHAYITIL